MGSFGLNLSSHEITCHPANQSSLAFTVYFIIHDESFGKSANSETVALPDDIPEILNRIAIASALVIGSFGLNTGFQFITCQFIQYSFAFSMYFIIHSHQDGISLNFVSVRLSVTAIQKDFMTIHRYSARVMLLSGIKRFPEYHLTIHFKARYMASFFAKLESMSVNQAFMILDSTSTIAAQFFISQIKPSNSDFFSRESPLVANSSARMK